MIRTYTLWDLEDANLIGTYPSQSAALDVVRRSLAEHGPTSMMSVGLGGEDDAGRTLAVAEGQALIALAERSGDRRIA